MQPYDFEFDAEDKTKLDSHRKKQEPLTLEEISEQQ